MGFAVYGNHGVTHWDQERAYNGVTLYSTQGGDKTHLVDMNGNVVHEWTPPAPTKPYYGFLRDNGNLLLRCYDGNEPYKLGGYSGVLVELDWDSNVVWRYDNPVIHHDHTLLRNGNIMVIGWEELTAEQASRVQGGKAGSEGSDHGMLGDFLLELTPDKEVVWEWHGWEKLDPAQEVICPFDGRGEWTHCNGVIELQDGNLCVSFRLTSQVIFIEKSTGDVNWRWGPGKIWHQHNPTQMENGNILIFDNGEHRDPGGSHSTVVEVDPKTDEIVWQFRGDPVLSFYSPNISGTQRLANGNTFICDGRTGRLFEVTTEGDVVWEFMNPEIAPWRGEKLARAVFRALRYPVDGPEVQGRV